MPALVPTLGSLPPSSRAHSQAFPLAGPVHTYTHFIPPQPSGRCRSEAKDGDWRARPEANNGRSENGFTTSSLSQCPHRRLAREKLFPGERKSGRLFPSACATLETSSPKKWILRLHNPGFVIRRKGKMKKALRVWAVNEIQNEWRRSLRGVFSRTCSNHLDICTSGQWPEGRRDVWAPIAKSWRKKRDLFLEFSLNEFLCFVAKFFLIYLFVSLIIFSLASFQSQLGRNDASRSCSEATIIMITVTTLAIIMVA